MDLPSCPACNQSVLDDDVPHCPFCGASMSGDGSTVSVPERPTTARTADSEASEAQPAATPENPPDTAGNFSDAPQSDSSESDPFAVESLDSLHAIPASLKPTKKRSWRVQCPMCETPGFVPRQAAGHEIKCANPQCLVPVFTAAAKPSAATTAPPVIDEPVASGGKAPLLAALLIIGAAGAGGAWWFVAGPSASPQEDSTTTPGNSILQSGSVNRPSDKADETAHDHADTQDPAATKATDPVVQVSPETIRDQAPALMVAAAQERSGNRSKPFCRRLTAEHFAKSGQQQAALAELKQLSEIGADLPQLHINALVELWWHQQADESASPGPLLAEAVQRSDKLSAADPFAVDVAVTLGSALIASGQVPLADSTTETLWSPTLPARLRLEQLGCRDSRTFHLANRLTSPPSLRDTASVDSLIIARLCSHGYSDAALAWARRDGQLLDRAERLAAWATASRNNTTAVTADDTNRAILDEPPGVRAVVHARLALVAATTNRPAAATEAISHAKQALQQCADVRTVALGNLKQLFQLPIDDVSDWWLKAQAQAELFGALSLSGQTDNARQVFADALATARSLGPARDDIAGRLKAIQSQGTAALIQQIRTVLEITGNDEARQAVQQYTRKCQDWLELGKQRAACLDRLHRWAISHGLGQDSWKDIQKHGLATETSIRDPFNSSTLPSFLYLSFQAAGNTTATAQMNRLLPTGLPVDTTENLWQMTRKALQNGDFAAVAQAVTADGNARRDLDSRFARRRVLFELVGVAADSKEPAQALHLVRSLRDPRLAIWREDAYRLVAAQLATKGHHTIAWQFATHADRVPTERVALLAGLLEGISTDQNSPTSSVP